MHVLVSVVFNVTERVSCYIYSSVEIRFPPCFTKIYPYFCVSANSFCASEGPLRECSTLSHPVPIDGYLDFPGCCHREPCCCDCSCVCISHMCQGVSLGYVLRNKTAGTQVRGCKPSPGDATRFSDRAESCEPCSVSHAWCFCIQRGCSRFHISLIPASLSAIFAFSLQVCRVGL